MANACADQVAGFLDKLSEIGADPQDGYSRLAYSKEERAAHALFRSTLEEYGLETYTDAVGNSYGQLPGSEGLPALMTGSHLDTVYSGGNFDGAAGVAAAVELARLFVQQGGLRHPVRVVAFAAEEGARFGAPCIGSRLATGAYDSTTLDQLIDRDGVTVTDAATSVGLSPGEFVLAVERRARAHATTVATVGRLDVTPNSRTTVPGAC